MKLSLTPRTKVSGIFRLVVLASSLAAGIVFIGLIFLVNQINPFFALSKVFSAGFGSVFGLLQTVSKSVPLMIVAIGLTLPFKGRFWNIGAEGQILMGALFSTWVGLNWVQGLDSWIAIPVLMVSGFMGGALWGLIPVVLRSRLGVNEVVSTLMLNYIGAELVKWLVLGPMKGATQFGYPYSDNLAASATLGFLPGTNIPYLTLVLALALSVGFYFLMSRSKLGYEIRVLGENPEAARYAGINFFRVTMIMMLLSGGLAGLAGYGEVGAVHHHLAYPDSISSGYGFTAIIVAWLARLNPLAIPVAALFFAGIVVGGDAIQISLKLPGATVQLFNGFLLIFLIAGDFFLNHKIVWRKK